MQPATPGGPVEPMSAPPSAQAGPSSTTNLGHIELPVSAAGRPSNACLRCKGRKTKCSCDRPKCQSCIKANVDCVYPSLMANRLTWDYVRQLEARLKAQEGGSSPTSSTTHNGDAANGDPSSPSRPAKRPRNSVHHDGVRSSTSVPQAGENGNDVHSSRSLASSSEQPEQPRVPESFMGPSALYHSDTSRTGPPSLFQLLDTLPRDAQLDSISFDPPAKPAPAASEGMYSNNHDPPLDKSILPTKEQIDQMVTYFLTYSYSGWLLVHIPTLHRQIHEVTTTDNPSPRDRFVVFMVFAISCTSQARGLPNSSDLRRRAQFYWSQAQPYLSSAVSRSGLGKLQAVHLVLQYVMHNPEAGNIWDLAGSASRIATDLGIHHESQSTNRIMKSSPVEQDLRRKLFWSTYCIDRNLAITLGRPPGIPDEWINARFPALVADELITDGGILPGPPDRKKEGAIHHAHLRILQSKIHHRLYTIVASNSAPPTVEWFQSMEQSIERWREAYQPDPTGFANIDWLDLQYHVTRSLLFRPTPGNRNPSRANLTKALYSSSFTMRLYREMWRRRNINYIWQAIHHLFMSGVTYLNSLWIASRYGWDIVPSLVDALLDIQACSCCLEAMTMNEHGTTGLRDAFENVSAAVIRRLSAERGEVVPALLSLNGNQNALQDQQSTLQPFNVNATNAPNISHDMQPSAAPAEDLTLPTMDFSWLMDPSRPASPAPDNAGPADALLDSFLLHPFVGLEGDTTLPLEGFMDF